ncbi:MAG: integrase arm-type DNA-binding domain-containing protein [Burkholderiaceae bacterium]|nr:integrase arm-type DNA-binding domain-containing protein [Burkholderiaceae bacterium]
MPLTDKAIRNAKPGPKPVRLADERGLYLEVTPSGGKWWRFRYRHGGKEKLLSMGTYPDTGLAQARERRDEARKLLADGIDPSEHRKATKAMRAERDANSFEAVAREWYAKMAPTWAASHGDKVIRRLERDVFPWIGGRPVADVTAPELLVVLRRIESRGTIETAHRALQNAGQVFRYAIATGRAERDPSPDLRGALPPMKHEHFAAVTDAKDIGPLLRKLDGHTGTLIVQSAIRLAPLVFVRPGELRMAEWADIDLDAAEWRYVVPKTKTPHIVPLSSQAVAILRDLHPLTGHGRFVFSGVRDHEKPMSDAAIRAAMQRLGIPKEIMSVHGWRATARTILDEVLGERPDLIEHQLAHAVRDPNGRAYNRTAHLPERHRMMQRWADWLDRQRDGAEVIPLRGGAA